MAKKPKNLSSEDRLLWDRVARSANPMRRRTQSFALTQSETKPPLDVEKPTFTLDISKLHLGASVGESPQPVRKIEPLRMDKKTHTRMIRGQLRPEARIDLHGMTQAQAHPALARFIHDAYDRHLRLVLVITGKGRSSDHQDYDLASAPRGVLRQNVPQWLRHPSLGRMILDIREAHTRHGGHGALYVYLRK